MELQRLDFVTKRGGGRASHSDLFFACKTASE